MWLTTATSVLVPVAGLVTAPVLARALGTDGRGSLAAAMAPAALILAVATLGLPDAATFYLAKDPRHTRRAVLSASLATVVLGLVCLVVVAWAAPSIAAGDDGLARLIVLAAALTIPSLVVNVARGAATGRQFWGLIAAERVLGTAVRILALLVLWWLDRLTVFSGVLALTMTPLVGAMVYLVLLRKPPDVEPPELHHRATLGALMSFGSRVWLGSVASMLLSRSDQLLMVPLSSTYDLGLYSVATTIADVPIIVTLAIGGALFGVNSHVSDPVQVARTSRLATLLSIVICVGIGATAPFWVAPLFGAGFEPAIVPLWLLLVGATVCVPSFMASAGLSAAGRPGLRSLGLLLAFAVNLTALLALVPSLGVVGACLTSILSNLVLSTFMVVAAARVTKVPASHFVRIRWADVLTMSNEVRRALTTLRRS